MLRVLGRRVLVKLIPQTSSDVIALTDERGPEVGDVLAVGSRRCEVCGCPSPLDLQPGMRVAIRPTAIVRKVTLDGVESWVVDADDVLGEIEPVEVTHG